MPGTVGAILMISRLELRWLRKPGWARLPFSVTILATGLFFLLAHEAVIEHVRIPLKMTGCSAGT